MPKSPSRTSKKKKYNARFPPARIKKIMQTDEEVGKVAAAVPVIISRALELFIESLITETSKTTVTKNAKTLSTSHIKHTIETNRQFDFLRDLVASISDHQGEDNNGDVSHDGESTGKKGRGRPRKQYEMKDGEKIKGETSKASSNTSEEEDEEDDVEDTETDEEGTVIAAATSSSTPFTSSAPQGIQGNSQDRLINSSLPGMDFLETKTLDEPVNLELGMPQPLNSLAVPGIQHQLYQQQYTSSNLPTFSAPPYPHFVPSPSQSMSSYPIPPQFQNCYTPVMPSSQHQFKPYGYKHPAPHQKTNEQQFHTQPQAQPQPINLSYASQPAATTANENDDYDT